jgi:hypothetical protein
MEPLVMILIPGLFGGLVLALIIATRRHRTPSVVVQKRLEAPSPELINMAHIRVEGIGGLGMVAAVIAVAITDPRIRLVTLAALVLGGALALLLIYYRRAAAEASSDGDGSANRSTLHLDDDLRARVVSSRTAFKDIERLGALSW